MDNLHLLGAHKSRQHNFQCHKAAAFDLTSSDNKNKNNNNKYRNDGMELPLTWLRLWQRQLMPYQAIRVSNANTNKNTKAKSYG